MTARSDAHGGSMTTPAGWYPDTEVPGGQRYWDGSAWSDQRRPIAPTEAAAVTEPAKRGAWARVSSAAKKAASDQLAAREQARRQHEATANAAGKLVTSGEFGTSTVEIYEGGYVRIAVTMAKNTPYEQLRSIRYTPPAASSAPADPLTGALGPAVAGLLKGGHALIKTSAPGLAMAGFAHMASVESRTSSLTIATDLTIHSLTNEVAYEFIKKVNSHHNGVGLVLQDAGNAVLRANGFELQGSTSDPAPVPATGLASVAVLPPAAPSLVERLRELAVLHAEGVLSDDEFADAKGRILGGL